jgi:hypothetical protein
MRPFALGMTRLAAGHRFTAISLVAGAFKFPPVLSTRFALDIFNIYMISKINHYKQWRY